MMQLTQSQIRWIAQQGGRDASQVYWDGDKPFLLMYNPRGLLGEERVYVPPNSELEGYI